MNFSPAIEEYARKHKQDARENSFTPQYQVIVGSADEETKDLFFGPLDTKDIFFEYPLDTTLQTVLCDLGIFPSKSESVRREYAGEVRTGFTLLEIRTTKNFVTRKHQVYILKWK